MIGHRLVKDYSNVTPLSRDALAQAHFLKIFPIVLPLAN